MAMPSTGLNQVIPLGTKSGLLGVCCSSIFYNYYSHVIRERVKNVWSGHAHARKGRRVASCSLHKWWQMNLCAFSSISYNGLVAKVAGAGLLSLRAVCKRINCFLPIPHNISIWQWFMRPCYWKRGAVVQGSKLHHQESSVKKILELSEANSLPLYMIRHGHLYSSSSLS